MIEALITGAVAIIVCMINNYNQNKAVQAKHDEVVSLIEYRLKQLEKKVELHNNAVERLYEAETMLKVHEEKISVVNHRIHDLEEDNK